MGEGGQRPAEKLRMVKDKRVKNLIAINMMKMMYYGEKQWLIMTISIIIIVTKSYQMAHKTTITVIKIVKTTQKMIFCGGKPSHIRILSQHLHIRSSQMTQLQWHLLVIWADSWFLPSTGWRMTIIIPKSKGAWYNPLWARSDRMLQLWPRHEEHQHIPAIKKVWKN